jgi:hypothetical protein
MARDTGSIPVAHSIMWALTNGKSRARRSERRQLSLTSEHGTRTKRFVRSGSEGRIQPFGAAFYFTIKIRIQIISGWGSGHQLELAAVALAGAAPIIVAIAAQ